MLNSIALIAGTHGNETSGIALLRQWQQHGVPDRFASLNPILQLANVPAMQANVRFVEEDLNRLFTPAALAAPPQSSEGHLAARLNQQLGPKGDSQTDLVIDIHNTTSAMGATLILLSADEFSVGLARYVKHHMPEANILLEDEVAYAEHPYLCTTGNRGLMIEVGGQPQGVLREDVYQLTVLLTETVLDYCLAVNTNSVPELPACDVYRLGHNVSFPLDENQQRLAMIHHSLQDADFQPLLPGAPVFKYFDGSETEWHGDEVTYPHFINEAAYARSHVAFATASLIKL